MEKLFILLLLFISNYSFAQSQKELLENIDKNISAIESMIKLSQLRIELSAVINEDFDPNDQFNFENDLQLESSNEEDIKQYFDSLKVSFGVMYPYSFITIGNDNSKIQSLLGKDNFYFMENPAMKPTFTPIEATFVIDKNWQINDQYVTTETVKNKYTKTIQEDDDTFDIVDTKNASAIEEFIWDEKSSFSNTIALLDPKPIKDIKVAISLPFQKSKILYINKGQDNLVTTLGTIKAIRFSGNEAVLQIPQNMDELVSIYAIYEDGRILNEKSSNSFTIFSEEKINAFQTYIDYLEKAKKQVEKNNIKTEKELEEYLLKNMPEATMNVLQSTEQTYSEHKYSFSGPIDKLAVIMDNAEVDTFHFTTTYEFDIDKENSNYFEVLDFDSEKTGIMDINGKWLVKPQFDEYFRMINRYYFTDQINDRENIYHFNPRTNKIHKTDYRIDDPEIYLDKYVKIEPTINGLIGVIDATTEEIKIPMTFDYIHLKDNKFWVGRNNDDYSGAYDTDFKEVVPFNYGNVEYSDGFFYVKDKDNSWNENVFDSKGNNLTQSKYHNIDGEFSDGRLLVETADKIKTGYYDNVKYYFLDEKGKIVIDLPALGYSEAKEFKEGLAVVKDKETKLYGFIDTKGKLIIPCELKSVSFGFYKESQYAPVQLGDGTYALIDKTGKVIKRFNSSFSTTYSRTQENGFCFKSGNIWYDAFGNALK